MKEMILCLCLVEGFNMKNSILIIGESGVGKTHFGAQVTYAVTTKSRPIKYGWGGYQS